jgi:hypothetical protein
MKILFIFFLCALGISSHAQNLNSDFNLSEHVSADYALLSSYEWLFNTNNNYHCKVAENEPVAQDSKSKVIEPSSPAIKSFNIYPNPAVDAILNVELELESLLPAILTLSDLTGKIIASVKVPANTRFFRHQFSTQMIPDAIILVSLVQGKNMITRKLVIDNNAR